MAGHVINPSTKFEDPTAIRSWVTLVPNGDSIRGFAHAAGFAAARRCLGLRFLVIVIFQVLRLQVQLWVQVLMRFNKCTYVVYSV